jgi:hypothetical protein
VRSLTTTYRAIIDKLTGRDFDKTVIRARLSTLDGIEFLCVGIVAVGLVGESLEIHHAGDVVTLGVLGEFVLHWFHVRASKRAEEIADEEADAARAAIADTNARAAEANLATERERLARIELEKSLEVRSLNPEQQAAAVTILRPFAGRAVTVIQTSDTDEVRLARWNVVRVLRAAGLSTTLFEQPRSVPAFGVQIELLSHGEQRDRDAASALASTLHDAGWEVSGPMPVRRPIVPRNWVYEKPRRSLPVIQVTVGTKRFLPKE